MFLTHRPTGSELESFVTQSADLSLSYHPIGITKEHPAGYSVDIAKALLGRGRTVFTRAQEALREWRQMDFGWVQVFPPNSPLAPGTVVAVQIEHHRRLWSLNGCRIVYSVDDRESSFGFAYGTLTNHAEMGEELFEISMNDLEEVTYRICAVSKPRALLARIGYPYARYSQARFRRDSIAAMKRHVDSR